MKTNYEIRYAEHPDDVKSYDTKKHSLRFPYREGILPK